MAERKLGRKKKVEKKLTEREKVEERREEVLAQGRKFKYPLQYAKHRLVINTILVVLVALAASMGALWAALYRVQSTSDILYRLTTVLPVSVAKVDGVAVRYSDYLLLYRSSITPVVQQQGLAETDSLEIVAQYKRAALTEAEKYAYAMKLAGELGVSVSGEEIDSAVTEHRKVGGTLRSEESFAKVVKDNFGLSMDEYRRMVYLTMIKTKVAEAVDATAGEVAAEVEAGISAGESLKKIAGELGEKVQYEETGTLVDRLNVDGGRAVKAMTLEAGQISERFSSSNGDGYYYVQLNEKTETQVDYISVKILLTEFSRKFEELSARDGGIREMIELEAEEEEE